MVDCRECRFFKHVNEMSEEEYEEASYWVARNRPGEIVRGYCTKYDRPVTRYRGRCSGFSRREIIVHRLDEYIPWF